MIDVSAIHDESKAALEDEIDACIEVDFPGEETDEELRECYRQYLLIRHADDPVAEAKKLARGWGSEVLDNNLQIAATALHDRAMN